MMPTNLFLLSTEKKKMDCLTYCCMPTINLTPPSSSIKFALLTVHSSNSVISQSEI